MSDTFKKNSAVCAAFGLSLALHVALFFPFTDYGSYNFARPVSSAGAVMVDLAMAQGKSAAKSHVAKTSSAGAKAWKPSVSRAALFHDTHADQEALSGGPAAEQTTTIPADQAASKKETSTEHLSKPLLQELPPPLRTAGEFTTTSHERLNYRISLLGMPIGVAELEAKNDKGEMKISLKVKSTPAISAVYPVDDLIETRHIAGNFIITKIKQQEGNFRSHRGFTIFLRDKSVFWIDLLRNRSSRETIPNSQVLDLMSAFYYLRNRPLQIGSTEELHVYDSDTYASVPVEILRRERISLPGFRHSETLVVKPNLKTDGIFKRTGDVTIWLTDDDYHVPVRMETSIPLGKITAELVSSQVDKLEPATPITSAPPLPKGVTP
ncbi:protein of unknown function, DUF3108-containing [Geotalea daltonii FRC-32]|uniref:DUF3108 domain-containing protein n=1 Tax=Geotalea daltonii (strain DSM 22248 / JCM 15807 / FRC-32) TaxID=316067 RepID=B9M6I1_GEODF|nr:DUF3108 domain-containing protein [Geotalea daltonii]ACM20041.1 protein of unknown function, DUF3108-containing [Geotalea daltonii FRC-32]